MTDAFSLTDAIGLARYQNARARITAVLARAHAEFEAAGRELAPVAGWDQHSYVRRDQWTPGTPTSRPGACR